MADLTAQGYQPTDAPDLVNGDYKKMLADLQALNTQVGEIVQQVQNQTSIIKNEIDVQSVSIDRNSQSIGSSSLFHETVKFSANGRTSTFIRILGSINFSAPMTSYVPYFGAEIVLDVNKPGDDMPDLRCSGVVSAFTNTDECVCTGTYCGSLSTNTLYCAMTTIDRNLLTSSGITSLLFQ